MGLTFHTGYRNLIVVGAGRGFCLVSGVHDPGFPWGDAAAVSDLLLAVLPAAGRPRRFLIGGDTLAGLTHEVAQGRFRYQGPIYELGEGIWRAALSELGSAAGLERREADIELELEVVPLHGGEVQLPRSGLLAEVEAKLGAGANPTLGDEKAVGLGMAIDPAAVRVSRGHIRLTGGEVLSLDAAGARGQAENGDYKALKAPPVRYHYLCGIHDAASRTTRPGEGRGPLTDGATQIVTDVLDPGGGGLVEDSIANAVSSVLRRSADIVMTWKDGVAAVREVTDDLAYHVAEPLLKLSWDTLATGVFDRKIVWIEGEGTRALGLEEDMMLKAAYGAESRTQAIAAVHVVKGPDKLALLDQVLALTGFDDLVRARAKTLGVTLAALKIALKPNFMFMYSLSDRSTFTDPELVLALIERLYGLGCRDIALVEAQSAYGNYFEDREVPKVASYVGYRLDDPRYRVVDLTAEMVPYDYGYKLGHHFVGPTWRDAQLRISFAKNKTHTWAYYTLGIKNTYGALPMQNKLREYHNIREIYYPTIDALRHFPLHFCLVDAMLSADGQFGIFADRFPNQTDTLIGGHDVIATDWVGASKMGLDPMVSRYMREAVFAFGKPEVVLHGDRSRYPKWQNVETAMTEFWDRAEEHYDFTDLILRVLNTMDARFKRRHQPWYVRLLRALTGWIRGLIFKRPLGLPPGEPPRPKPQA